MPRYTLTLIDSTNQTTPIVLTAESTRTIIRQLTKRLDPTPERRRVQGSGGFTMERGRVKAFRELPPDPATGNRRRATAFGATRAEAERRLNEKIAELKRVGRLGYTKPPTVAEWCDHWLNDICKPHLKPRTWGTYASVIERNVKPAIGAVRLDELKPAHFRRMERYVMEEQGKSSGTAGSAWRTLHKALEDAVLEGVIERNPAVKGTAPRVALKERAVLTPEQAADLIAAETDDTWRLMWMLAFMTGMRQGERLGLTEDELRRDGDRLIILVEWQAQHLTKREVEGLPKGVECTPLGNGMYRTRPKTEKGRRAIPLPEALADQLLAYIERHGVNGDGLVFHDDEGLPLTGSVERRRWYRALDRVGLGHEYVPHSARHTTATILNRLGLDDVTRTAIMGHSRVSTTNEIYTHVELDRLVAATDGVERAAKAVAQLADLGPGRRARPAPQDHRRTGHAGLLLRPAQPMAARHQ